MPKKSKLNLPPLDLGDEKLNQRIARLRKERGLTQVELSKKIGITRELVSDYERGKIRPHYEMIVRFALAFEITTDELLGLKIPKTINKTPSLKVMRRLNKIEQLPFSQQRVLLQTIDNFLKGVER